MDVERIDNVEKLMYETLGNIGSNVTATHVEILERKLEIYELSGAEMFKMLRELAVDKEKTQTILVQSEDNVTFLQEELQHLKEKNAAMQSELDYVRFQWSAEKTLRGGLQRQTVHLERQAREYRKRFKDMLLSKVESSHGEAEEAKHRHRETHECCTETDVVQGDVKDLPSLVKAMRHELKAPRATGDRGKDKEGPRSAVASRGEPYDFWNKSEAYERRELRISKVQKAEGIVEFSCGENGDSASTQQVRISVVQHLLKKDERHSSTEKMAPRGSHHEVPKPVDAVAPVVPKRSSPKLEKASSRQQSKSSSYRSRDNPSHGLTDLQSNENSNSLRRKKCIK